jgi:alkylhydroperoxidase family enzyme
MKCRRTRWLSFILALIPPAAWAGSGGFAPLPTNEEAWRTLPPAEEGAGKPLPAWVRALSVALPQTAAAMIELDYAQRAESELPPRFRAMLRWAAADSNRCEYARVYARADFVRAGGQAEDIDRLWNRLDRLPEAERLAVQLVRQLCEAAYSVSDAEIARLVQLFGEKQVMAIVLVAAYANFQDRLLLGMGIAVEPEGPLPAVLVRFRKPPPPAKDKGAAEPNKEPAPRKVSAPAKDLPPVPARVDDPEWTAVPYAQLQERLAEQKDRPKARIPIPSWEEVRKNLPAEMAKRPTPLRIRWSLLNYGYQPRLSTAWLGGLRAFRRESDLEVVYQESLFWVVTRSAQCFY